MTRQSSTANWASLIALTVRSSHHPPRLRAQPLHSEDAQKRTPRFSSENWVSSQWYPDEMNANWQGGNSMVSGVSGPRG